MRAKFQITARDEAGRLHVATVRSATSSTFRPADVAKALARASARGRAVMLQRGIKRPIPTAVVCLD